MRGRNQYAANRRAVAAMTIGIQYQVRHPRGQPRVDSLFQAQFIEGRTDRFRADNRDRLA